MQGFPVGRHEPRGSSSQGRIPITRSFSSRDSTQRASRGLRCEASSLPLPGTLNLGFDAAPVAEVLAAQRRLTAEREGSAAAVPAEQPQARTPRARRRPPGLALGSRAGGREQGRGSDSCSGSRGRAPPSSPPSPRLTYYPLLLLPLLFQNTRRREQNTMPPRLP